VFFRGKKLPIPVEWRGPHEASRLRKRHFVDTSLKPRYLTRDDQKHRIWGSFSPALTFSASMNKFLPNLVHDPLEDLAATDEAGFDPLLVKGNHPSSGTPRVSLQYFELHRLRESRLSNQPTNRLILNGQISFRPTEQLSVSVSGRWLDQKNDERQVPTGPASTSTSGRPSGGRPVPASTSSVRLIGCTTTRRPRSASR